MKQADAILEKESLYHPLVVVLAATVKLDSLDSLLRDEFQRELSLMSLVLSRSITKLRNGESPAATDIDHSMIALAFCHVGMCYEQLEDDPNSLQAFNQGLEIDPDNDALLVLRGMSQYGSSPQAIEDFHKAAGEGHSLVWPYDYLAHHLLVTERFDECRLMTERALRCEASDLVKADLHEWHAIASHHLSFPPERIRAELEKAAQLAPENTRIRGNLASFQKDIGRQHRGQPEWATPGVASIQAIGQADYNPSFSTHLLELVA